MAIFHPHVKPKWSCSNGDISCQHRESVTLGTYAGIAWDLLTFAANFQPRLEGTGSLLHFCNRFLEEDPLDL